jgi:hypothetical protein
MILGFFFLIEGIPQESITLANFREGKFRLTGWVLLYFSIFIALNIAG